MIFSYESSKLQEENSATESYHGTAELTSMLEPFLNYRRSSSILDFPPQIRVHNYAFISPYQVDQIEEDETSRTYSMPTV
jgi:hypothetical protein